jgi:hypothetical protein
MSKLSARSRYLSELINKTRNAPAKTQEKFVMQHWNKSGDSLERLVKRVKVVNKRIIVE